MSPRAVALAAIAAILLWAAASTAMNATVCDLLHLLFG